MGRRTQTNRDALAQTAMNVNVGLPVPPVAGSFAAGQMLRLRVYGAEQRQHDLPAMRVPGQDKIGLTGGRRGDDVRVVRKQDSWRVGPNILKSTL